MAGSPQHATLVAATPATLTFDQDFDRIEVLNVDGAAEVYFRVGSTAPTVGGTGCQVLPAAICAVEVDVFTSGPTVVQLISAGTPKVSVREVIVR
jgi:hypothetical protein